MGVVAARLDILPEQQRELWNSLQEVLALGMVLYGGTAIALRLGHRQSVDFDFFSEHSIDADQLRKELSFLRNARVVQQSVDTLSVLTGADDPESAPVKVSFFGSIGFGRFSETDLTDDGILELAGLDDLMATKLKVILQRGEAKDYRDIAAMLQAGVRLDRGLAIARGMYGPAFQPSESLRALTYFEDGDLRTIDGETRTRLIEAAAAVRRLPPVRRLSTELTATMRLPKGGGTLSAMYNPQPLETSSRTDPSQLIERFEAMAEPQASSGAETALQATARRNREYDLAFQRQVDAGLTGDPTGMKFAVLSTLSVMSFTGVDGIAYRASGIKQFPQDAGAAPNVPPDWDRYNAVTVAVQEAMPHLVREKMVEQKSGAYRLTDAGYHEWAKLRVAWLSENRLDADWLKANGLNADPKSNLNPDTPLETSSRTDPSQPIERFEEMKPQQAQQQTYVPGAHASITGELVRRKEFDRMTAVTVRSDLPDGHSRYNQVLLFDEAARRAAAAIEDGAVVRFDARVHENVFEREGQESYRTDVISRRIDRAEPGAAHEAALTVTGELRRGVLTGEKVTMGSLVSETRDGEPRYHSFKAFDDDVRAALQSPQLGDRLTLTGTIGQSSFERDGKKVYTTDLVIDRVAEHTPAPRQAPAPLPTQGNDHRQEHRQTNRPH